MGRTPLVAVVALALTASSACSGGGDDVAVGPAADSVPDAAPASTVAPAATAGSTTSLPAVTDGGGRDDAVLGATVAAPFDRVEVVGLERAAGTIAAVDLRDGSWWPIRLLEDDEGVYLLAPVAPADPLGGGAVEMVLTDGSTVGPSLTLQVDGFAPSDGQRGAQLVAFRDAVDAEMRPLGSSWDELAATPVSEVPPTLSGLKTVQMLLDGSDESVMARYAEFGDDEAALFDALIAQVGLAAPVDVDDVGPSLVDDEPGEGADAEGVAEPGERAVTGFRGSGFRSASARGGADCIPPTIDTISSAAQLSELMTRARLGAIATDASTKPGRTLAAAEMAIAVGGMIEAALTEGQGKFYATVAHAVTAHKIDQALAAGNFPSFFSAIEVEVDPVEMEEDREEPGRWSRVRVTAQSTGYVLDADVAGLAIDKVGGSILGEAGLDKGKLIDIEAGAAVGEVKNAVVDALPADGVLRFCPGTWLVDITGEEWSWARPLDGVLTVDNAATTYENRTAVAADTLRFAPWPFKFGGATITTDVAVSTEAIDVQVDPDVVTVTTPGDVVPITASIDHAVVETLAWYTERGEWVDGTGVDTNGPTTRPLRTPTDPRSYPFRVEVESTSKQGLRALDGAPRRYDFVTVELAPIIVTPNPASTEPGKQVTFAATDHEGEQVEVNWSATGGTIDGDGTSIGVYTAGDREGTYEVTASLVGNPAVFVTVIVEIATFCLRGHWRVNADHFAGLLSAAGLQVEPAGGTWDIVVERDRSFTASLNGFALTVKQDGFTGTLTMNGAQTGNVLATSTEITGVETVAFSLDVLLDGPAGPIRMSPDDVPVGTEFGGGPYRCEGGQLIVERDGNEILYDRVD